MAISVIGGSTTSSSTRQTLVLAATNANTQYKSDVALSSGVWMVTTYASALSSSTITGYVSFINSSGTTIASANTVDDDTASSVNPSRAIVAVTSDFTQVLYSATAAGATIYLERLGAYTPVGKTSTVVATITTSGTYTITNADNQIYLIGGGGAGNYYGGGGGSGYYATGSLPTGTYTVTIGAGGARDSSGPYQSASGSATSFGTISAAGGKGGYNINNASPYNARGGDGGSGGGGYRGQGGSNGASGGASGAGPGGAGSGVTLPTSIFSPGPGGQSNLNSTNGTGGGTYAGGGGSAGYTGNSIQDGYGYGGGGGGNGNYTAGGGANGVAVVTYWV